MTTLTERYFRPKPFELDGRLYTWLGVALFKRLLMGAVRVDPAKPTANAYVLGGRSLDDVRRFERKSRRSELVHLGGLVMALIFLTFAAVVGGLFVAGAIVFVANFHCFLLQRYNRVRMYRVLDRGRAGSDAES